MDISLSHPLVYLVPLGTFILGYGLARGSSDKHNAKILEKELEKQAAQFEQEQSELSTELGEKFGEMREGLIATIQAYQSAVGTCSDRLPISNEIRTALDNPVIGGSSSSPSESVREERVVQPEDVTEKQVASSDEPTKDEAESLANEQKQVSPEDAEIVEENSAGEDESAASEEQSEPSGDSAGEPDKTEPSKTEAEKPAGRPELRRVS